MVDPLDSVETAFDGCFFTIFKFLLPATILAFLFGDGNNDGVVAIIGLFATCLFFFLKRGYDNNTKAEEAEAARALQVAQEAEASAQKRIKIEAAKRIYPGMPEEIFASYLRGEVDLNMPHVLVDDIYGEGVLVEKSKEGFICNYGEYTKARGGIGYKLQVKFENDLVTKFKYL
ncbi:hypothetical protein N9470_01355 [Emcibacteraceae bacterium]|nr:hypothetical protein [Emcibacteraceae bacterium]